MRPFLAPMLIALAATTACKTDRAHPSDSQKAATPAGQPAAAAPAPAAPAVAVMITSPTKGATTGTDVTVTLRSQGVTIAKSDGKMTEGIGHHHLFLDTIPTMDNMVIPPNSAKVVHIGTGDSTYTFKNLPRGTHRIIAVIGYGDHMAMPGRRDTLDITVK